MPFTSTYCKKCGTVGFSFLDNVCEDNCFSCNTQGTLEPIPEKYLDGISIKEDLKDEFIEEVVKKSPDFDQKAFDRIPEVQAIMKRNREILQNAKEEQNNKPKCPTCQSTNIRKMGAVESGASIFAFGIFSKKINKTFKCGNCGYTW